MSMLSNVRDCITQDQELTSDFIRLAQDTVLMAHLVECDLVPFSGLYLPHFRKMSIKGKKAVIEHLKSFNAICEQVLSNGKSLKDSAALTWYALRKFDLHFPSDLFNHIKDNDVIEVYDRTNVQLFRNFRFFEMSSYTLEDLLCRSWTELFKREKMEHTESIIETCKRFYSKEVTTVTPLSHVGIHRIEESDSPFYYKMDAVIKYLAPIYDKQRYPCGFIAIESANLVCEQPTGRLAEELLQNYYARMAIASI
ncbi:MAG: hypothetical protein AAGB31_11210 [Bdellovibrio sp.]